ncbi:Protein DEL-7 [Aphelenchoides avenae]|nr:Protein DEL-7 [Aphelenchus avenae]
MASPFTKPQINYYVTVIHVTKVDGSSNASGTQRAPTANDAPPWTAIGAHGMGQVKQARSAHVRTAWVLFVGCGVIASIVNTRVTFSDYLDNVSTTLITIVPQERLRMPTIYICPKNPDSFNQTLVLNDMRKHLGRNWRQMNETRIRQLLEYAIAGAGFHNVEKIVAKFTQEDKARLSRLFRKWVDGRAYETFFKLLFERYAYRCRDLFDRCYYAKHPLFCCDIFEQAYVMLRGRCFRLKRFYQSDPDQYGKLVITVNQITSWFIDKSGIQLIIKKRHIKMLDSSPHCKNDCKHCGKSRCYIKKWLFDRVIDRLNCTLYYERHMAPGYDVCDPDDVFRIYESIGDVRMNGTKCFPACDREDYSVKHLSSADMGLTERTDSRPNLLKPTFRIDAYYSELEVEQYEEHRRTSIPGFVSELGGQSNLILGLSVISALQAIRIIVTLVYDAVHKLLLAIDAWRTRA